MEPIHKELIARFKTIQDLNHFIQVYHSVLDINRLHYFPSDINFDSLKPAEKRLYTTVLIRPAPNAPNPLELINQIYQQLSQGQGGSPVSPVFPAPQESPISQLPPIASMPPSTTIPSMFPQPFVVVYVHYNRPFGLYDAVPPEQDPHAWWFQAINCQEALLPYTIPEKKKIKIAVIDTGIQYNHPDLDDFRNKGVARDFTKLKWADGQLVESNKDGTAIDLGLLDNGESDVHGTHLAGLIGALRMVTSHTIGLAHQATLLNFRAWQPQPSDATLAVAIRSAADMGAKVINASWGRAKKDATNECALSDAIDYACTQGTVVVCAAGNFKSDIDNYIPARFKNVIVVGSVDIPKKEGGLCNRSEDSNYGDRVIGAPGVNILSLDALDISLLREMSGTSMSAAIVSGLVTRMIEINPGLVLPSDNPKLPCNAADVILKKIVTIETDQRDSHPFNMIDVDETLRQLRSDLVVNRKR